MIIIIIIISSSSSSIYMRCNSASDKYKNSDVCVNCNSELQSWI